MDSHTHSALHHLKLVETGRRRRWSEAEKERIVLESMAGPREISATARRHGIARSQLLAWRRAMITEDGPAPAGFVPLKVVPDAVRQEARHQPDIVVPPRAAGQVAERSAAPGRIKIVLRSGRKLIVEGAIDADAVLKLARGLEALK